VVAGGSSVERLSFNSVLALDVIHDDLPKSTLATYESAQASVAEWYWETGRGCTATYGSRVIWATYQGDVPRRTVAAEQYRRQYLADGLRLRPLQPDGRVRRPRRGRALNTFRPGPRFRGEPVFAPGGGQRRSAHRGRHRHHAW
jgi:hypothetical protein